MAPAMQMLYSRQHEQIAHRYMRLEASVSEVDTVMCRFSQQRCGMYSMRCCKFRVEYKLTGLNKTHQNGISRRIFLEGQGQKRQRAQETTGRRADLTWYAGMLCTSPSQVRTCSSLPAVELLLGKFCSTASIMDGVTSTASISWMPLLCTFHRAACQPTCTALVAFL